MVNLLERELWKALMSAAVTVVNISASTEIKERTTGMEVRNMLSSVLDWGSEEKCKDRPAWWHKSRFRQVPKS